MQTLKKGNKGRNVVFLKHYLNMLVMPSPGLSEKSNVFDTDTENAVNAYKTQNGLTPLDGICDPKTWGAICKDLGNDIWLADAFTEIPEWLMALATGKTFTNGPLAFDRGIFFPAYMDHYGALSDSQLAGLERLLEFIDRDPAVPDVRWAAYMLATVKWECANTWQPIREYGKGAGHSYGTAKTVTGSDGTKYTNTYYGRGYVQLTWEANYKAMSSDLGMGEELWLHPDRVLEPDIAYKVLSFGMTTGKSFANGHKLKDYEDGATGYKYKNARHMVNGTDHAADIADIATHLEAMLRASLY